MVSYTRKALIEVENIPPYKDVTARCIGAFLLPQTQFVRRFIVTKPSPIN